MAALLLALAVGALALDAPESTKSMIKDGGRRLQGNENVGWGCNVDGNTLYFPADGDACPGGMVPADLAACASVVSPQCAGPGNLNNAPYIGLYTQSAGECEPIGGQLVGRCFRTLNGQIIYQTSPCTTPNTLPSHGVCMMAPPDPTVKPTADPTASPTFSPTVSPTFNPTPDPTASPTFSPTLSPTFNPTPDPTASPTFFPTVSPTINPTPDQFEPLRVATADLSTKINSASSYEEAKVQVKVVKKLTKALPACASLYKEMLRKKTNQLLRRIRKKKAWSDLAGRLATIMNLQDNLQACA